MFRVYFIWFDLATAEFYSKLKSLSCEAENLVSITLPLQMGKNPESVISPGAHPSRSILLGSPPCFLPQPEASGREGCQAGLSLPAAPPCGPPRLRAFPEGCSSCQEATHGASVSPGVGSRPSPRSAHILVVVLFQALSKPPG